MIASISLANHELFAKSSSTSDVKTPVVLLFRLIKSSQSFGYISAIDLAFPDLMFVLQSGGQVARVYPDAMVVLQSGGQVARCLPIRCRRFLSHPPDTCHSMCGIRWDLVKTAYHLEAFRYPASLGNPVLRNRNSYFSRFYNKFRSWHFGDFLYWGGRLAIALIVYQNPPLFP